MVFDPTERELMISMVKKANPYAKLTIKKAMKAGILVTVFTTEANTDLVLSNAIFWVGFALGTVLKNRGNKP